MEASSSWVLSPLSDRNTESWGLNGRLWHSWLREQNCLAPENAAEEIPNISVTFSPAAIAQSAGRCASPLLHHHIFLSIFIQNPSCRRLANVAFSLCVTWRATQRGLEWHLSAILHGTFKTQPNPSVARGLDGYSVWTTLFGHWWTGDSAVSGTRSALVGWGLGLRHVFMFVILFPDSGPLGSSVRLQRVLYSTCPELTT